MLTVNAYRRETRVPRNAGKAKNSIIHERGEEPVVGGECTRDGGG